MSTAAIIAIAVAAIVLIALIVVVLPRGRADARRARASRELDQRRERAATEHREEAHAHQARAEEAERQARMAEQVAQRERADASLRAEEADRHLAGEADASLVEEHERDRFAEVADIRDERTEDRGGRFDRQRERPDEVVVEPPPERLRRR